VLSTATRVLATLRAARKPLHPLGDRVTGRLDCLGSGVALENAGVPLLDEAGHHDVVVRFSQAAGLPRWLPDVQGLALRVPLSTGRHADLLLASTGLGRLTRFALTPTRSRQGRPLTTLLPYRTATGPVVIAAQPSGPLGYDLLWARPSGAWHVWGRLTVAGQRGPDPVTSFDAVENEAPGLRNYDWVRRLREPAYREARRSRGDGVDPQGRPTRPDAVGD
jgi:hypothetical protein